MNQNQRQSSSSNNMNMRQLPYSTVNPLNSLSSSNHENRHDSNNRMTGSNHDITNGGDDMMIGDRDFNLDEYDDQDEDDIDSLSDISTEKSDYVDSNRKRSSANKNSSAAKNTQKKRPRSNGTTVLNIPNQQQQPIIGSSSTQVQSSSMSHASSVIDQKTKSKNREHAKKTRIRKKNYIESLRETVKNLSEEREKADRDSRIALTRLIEQVCLY